MDTHRSRSARLVVLAVMSIALAGVVTTLPAPTATLDGNSSATYTNPRAPGADGRYTVTVLAERNDTIVRNGLKELSLDFGADRDFSGDVTAVSGSDVAVYLGKAN